MPILPLRARKFFRVSLAFSLAIAALTIPTQSASAVAANTLNTAMGTQLRTLRLAVASAAGFSAQYAGSGSDLQKKQNVYNAIQAGIDRINEVYLVEIGVRLNLIAFNANIIFLDSSTDPYGETNESTDMDANQTLLNAQVGSANYDIGHVLTSNGGGKASMQVLSGPSNKGRGTTGGTSASGDGFWIELVAHEIGHQLGADHAFDGTTGSCASNVASGYNTEVGSGSSIMSYAGTCGVDDIQSGSDAYFTPFSYEQIRQELAAAPSVGTTTSLTNTVPQISVASATYKVPPRTPFTLTASGSDADSGNTLTYSWDQLNTNTSGKTLASESKTVGALFRPWAPSSSPSRTFPKLESLFSGVTNQNTGSCLGFSATADLLACRVEFLPTVARTLNFRATIRDGVGGRNGANVAVDVTGTTPFAITSHNNSIAWRAGSTQTLTWNTGGTEAWIPGFSTVEISYTQNNGSSWTSLATGVSNNGSYSLTVPTISSTNFRFKIQPTGAIFFDINDAPLTIMQSAIGTSAPPMGLTAAVTTTAGAIQISWSLPVDTGTSVVTRYQVTASPGGATCSTTSTAPASPTRTCTISGLTLLTAYTFVATATNASGISDTSTSTSAVVASAVPAAPTITSVEQISDGSIKVNFSLNSANGSPIIEIKIGHCVGSTCTSYINRWTISNNGATSYIYPVGSGNSNVNIGNLNRFTVWAVNSVGVSSGSAISAAVLSALASANTASNISLALAGGVTQVARNQTIVITATVDQVGKVSFFADGKKITKCAGLLASGSTKTCSWKPSILKAVQLSATLTPTSSSYLPSTAFLNVGITRRTGTR
jgi:hypothetical protein